MGADGQPMQYQQQPVYGQQPPTQLGQNNQLVNMMTKTNEADNVQNPVPDRIYGEGTADD